MSFQDYSPRCILRQGSSRIDTSIDLTGNREAVVSNLVAHFNVGYRIVELINPTASKGILPEVASKVGRSTSALYEPVHLTHGKQHRTHQSHFPTQLIDPSGVDQVLNQSRDRHFLSYRFYS